MKKCPNFLTPLLSKTCKKRLPLKSVFGAIAALSVAFDSSAAGAKMGDFYLQLGGGAFAPMFTLQTAGSIDGPPGQTTIYATLPNGGGTPIPLIGLEFETDEEQLIKPENRSMISLGGVFGYQVTDEFSAEIGLDLAMLEIDVQNLYILKDVLPGNPETINIQILPPDLLPITFSGVYTFFPSARVSPYIGFGAMMAMLDNRRAPNTATNIVVLDGGVEFGYIAHAGLKLDVSEGMYAFADFKYGRISNPDIKDRFGTPVSVEKFEVRHMRFGIGYPI